jgi:hypothetical protein
MWDVEATPEAEEWLLSLDSDDFRKMAAAIDLLQERGPSLGRPTVDRIGQSRHRNLKELRSRGGHLRLLFAFDPRRRAILLVGGDKTNEWRRWYDRNVPLADDLLDEHLREVRDDQVE